MLMLRPGFVGIIRPARFAQRMSTATPGPMETSMRDKLQAAFSPKEMSITNDSWQHRSHAAMKAQGGGNGETRKPSSELPYEALT
jgi:hypothetical protein